MATIDSVVNSINSAKDDLVLLNITDIQSQELFLVRKIGQVSYADSLFVNMQGIAFQIDSDWANYRLKYVNCPFIGEGYLSGRNGSTFDIKVGDEQIKGYLRNLGHWERGINFKDKWDKLLGAIDVYINRELLPVLTKNP